MLAQDYILRKLWDLQYNSQGERLAIINLKNFNDFNYFFLLIRGLTVQIFLDFYQKH